MAEELEDSGKKVSAYLRPAQPARSSGRGAAALAGQPDRDPSHGLRSRRPIPRPEIADQPPDDDGKDTHNIFSRLDHGTKWLYEDLTSDVLRLAEYDIPDELDLSNLPNDMSDPIDDMVEATRALAGVTIEHNGGADIDIRFTADYRASAYGAVAWRKTSSDVLRLVRVALAFHGAREDGWAARWRTICS